MELSHVAHHSDMRTTTHACSLNHAHCLCIRTTWFNWSTYTCNMSSEGRGLSKWQVAALGVGAAAVVAGGAIVAYACVKRRSSRRQKRDEPPKATPQSQSSSTGSGAGSQSETPAASQPSSEQLVRTGIMLDLICSLPVCIMGVHTGQMGVQYLE